MMPTRRKIGELTALLYRNRGVFPLLGSPTIPLGEARCVGGGTAINGALLWRTPPRVLDEWRTVNGLTGYGEDNLARHFDTVESDLHVTRHELEEDANLDSLNLFRGAGQPRLEGFNGTARSQALRKRQSLPGRVSAVRQAGHYEELYSSGAREWGGTTRKLPGPKDSPRKRGCLEK